MGYPPDIVAMTPAPLRNRLRIALRAPVAEVWELIGDVRRMPEYSAGLERVAPVVDAAGKCTEYVCYFRRDAGGTDGLVHRAIVQWLDPMTGYASRAEPGNAFGLRDDLNLVTVAPCAAGTLLTWDEYFESADVATGQTSYDQAFAGIAAQLIRRFGGHLVELYKRPSGPGDGAAVTIERLTDALHRGDAAAATALYEEDAALVTATGNVARGAPQVREALRAFMALRPTLITEAQTMVETRGLVLYHGRWCLTGVGPDGSVAVMRGESADILREQPDGSWRIVLDNPWGAGLMAPMAARGD